MIVNGFDRLSGPATVESPFLQGFDLNTDPGIPYINTPAFCGTQQSFDRSRIGRETKDGLGYSGSELEGRLIAGNTFDYPFIHGKAIQATGGTLLCRVVMKPLKMVLSGWQITPLQT